MAEILITILIMAVILSVTAYVIWYVDDDWGD